MKHSQHHIHARAKQAPSLHPNLWQLSELAELTGGPLRPGGLELTSAAFSALELPPGSHVLDIGCGNGSTASLLAGRFGHKVTGLDYTFTQAKTTSSKGWHSVQGSAELLPYADALFDAIVCECVLSLTTSIPSVCREMARVLKPSGVLVLSDLYLKTPRQCVEKVHCANPGPVKGHHTPQTSGYAGCACGAVSMAAIRTALDKAGMCILSLSDESNALRQLTAELVFAGVLQAPPSGSGQCRASPVQPLPSSASPTQSTCHDAEQKTQLGYYQLIAGRYSKAP